MNSGANPIWTLAWTFGLMSLFAVGGANAAIPEMHRVAVDVQHWMTDTQFADVFAISQMSPGPNVLIVTLIGYSVAGIAVALARHYSGGAGSTFDRIDGRQWLDFGADLRSDLDGRPGHGHVSGTGLC